jgi:nucleoside-diphosphate-sugar epimerase
MRVLIVGCGYLGTPLGEALVRQGHQVAGLRRSPGGEEALQSLGIAPLVADITRPDELTRLPGPYDWVVDCVSSARGGAEVYRQVYLEGTRNLIRWLAGSGLRKFIFTGSTSVYAQADGATVTEACPAVPDGETSRILAQTEALLLEAARMQSFPAVLLRLAGIYGPGRGHLFRQYLRGEAHLTGAGERLINMVHLADAVGAVIAALERGRAGEIYNVADDEPVAQREFFSWLSQALGRPMPPAAALENPARKRGLTHKRVSNAKLKNELGYRFQYPSFREGYRDEVARVLKIEPPHSLRISGLEE